MAQSSASPKYEAKGHSLGMGIVVRARACPRLVYSTTRCGLLSNHFNLLLSCYYFDVVQDVGLEAGIEEEHLEPDADADDMAQDTGLEAGTEDLEADADDFDEKDDNLVVVDELDNDDQKSASDEGEICCFALSPSVL